MKGKRIPVRIVLAVFVVLGSWNALPRPADAQTDVEVFVTELAGAEIRANAPWFFDPGMHEADPAVDTEIVGLMTWNSAVIIGYLPGFASPVQARDLFMSTFEAEMDDALQVDRGDYGAVSYSLDIAEIDGVKLGMFTLFLTDRPSGYLEMTCLMAEPPAFAAELESAQASITIDGETVFDGVDGSGLQALLLAAQPDHSASAPATPVTTPVGDELAQMRDLGFVEDGLYVSPQFGTEVTWGSEWVLDTILGEPLESSTLTKQDSVLLDWTGGMIGFAGVAITGGNLDSYEMWLEEGLGEGDELDVLLTRRDGDRTAVVFRLSAPNGFEMFAVSEAWCGDPTCGFAIGVIVMAVPATLVFAYTDAQASITIDGVPVFNMLSPEEVRAALDQ